MKIDYCAKIKAGLFLPAFTLMLELSGKTLAMCLFPGMPIVFELNEAEFEDADVVCRWLIQTFYFLSVKSRYNSNILRRPKIIEKKSSTNLNINK